MKSGFRLNNIKFSFNDSIKTTRDFFSKRRVTLFSINEDLNSQNTLEKLKNFEGYYDRIKKLGLLGILLLTRKILIKVLFLIG